METTLKGLVLAALVMLTIASQTDVKRDELGNSDGADLDPLQNTDQDFSEKDHSKRTFGSTTYDTYGLAKHIRIKGGQRVVLGYTPVDLKYVPVIRPWRNSWRFQQRPVSRPKPVPHLPVKPKPDANGWKPLLHVPPPQQSHGWAKPAVTVLKPIRPSAPDYHHDDQHIHNHHHHEHDDHHHRDVHHDIVHDQHPVVPVVPTIHTVPQDHYDGHLDFVHHQPHPQVLYYHPLAHVTRPALPVLPLGATFNVPVGTIAPAAPVAPVAVPTEYYHPQQHFVPSVPIAQPHTNIVHEVPAPHFHPTSVPIAPITITPAAVPNYYDHHHHHHNVHEHVPQVYEYPLDIPQHQPVPVTPVASVPVEYHGHVAHLINTPYQNHHYHNAHQYIPENYNPHILPGSTGTLSSGFLNPGYTDLQIPEHLPDHPVYNGASASAPTEETYYHGHVGLLPEGIVQPQLALEPPINK